MLGSILPYAQTQILLEISYGHGVEKKKETSKQPQKKIIITKTSRALRHKSCKIGTLSSVCSLTKKKKKRNKHGAEKRMKIPCAVGISYNWSDHAHSSNCLPQASFSPPTCDLLCIFHTPHLGIFLPQLRP
jgi:hypothetical protein